MENVRSEEVNEGDDDFVTFYSFSANFDSWKFFKLFLRYLLYDFKYANDFLQKNKKTRK